LVTVTMLRRALLPLVAASACNALVGLDDYRVATPCEADGTCVAGTKSPNGTACDAPEICASAHCVDGRCCETACDGECEACGDGGVCAPAAAGTDPDGECAPGTCDGASRCATGDADWVLTIGDDDGESLLPQVPLGVALDAAGDVLVGGYVLGVVDFGEAMPVTAESADAFVAKRAGSDGSPLWTRVFVADGAQQTNAVAVLAPSTVVFGGAFAGSIDLGDGSLTGTAAENVFVASLDAAGDHVFGVDGVESGEIQQALAVTAAARGATVAAGSFEGTLDLDGPGPLPPLASTMPDRADALVAGFAGDGAPLWAERFGGAEDQRARGIAASADGERVVVVGDFKGNLDLGSRTLMNADPMRLDGFVAALEAGDGGTMWTRQLGGADDQAAAAVAVDRTGAVVVAGDFKGTLDLGDGTELGAIDKHDAFVAALDDAGNVVWALAFGATGEQRATAVAVDLAGNVIVAGYFDGTLEVDGAMHGSAGADDAFVVKLAKDGTVLWHAVWGGDDGDDERALAVATGPDASIVVAGTFFGTADFGTGPLASAGADDGFVVKLAP
jgi:hypothetical protein